MKKIPDNRIDSVVVDPPYGISFMGKKWDYDIPSVEVWGEVLRVLKPGGHMLCACGTRTQHRMVVNIEDAGFEIRDVVSWVYGCLSDDTEILIDGQWEPYHKAIAGSLALCYCIENDTFQWEPIQELMVYEYDDTAYRIQSDNTDQIVSRNHRCLVERSGGKEFAYAETLEREESVPILEDVRGLLESLPVPHKRTSTTEQVVSRLQEEEHGAVESGEEASKDRVSGLSDDVLSNGPKQESAAGGVLVAVQRETESCGVSQTLPQGQSRLDQCKPEVLHEEDEWAKQSSMEGRSNVLQETRQLQANQVCAVSERTQGDGSQRRLHNGAPTNSCYSDGQMLNSQGSGASCQSRSTGQQPKESIVVCEQQGSQAVRASRHTSSDLARVEPIYYKGKVWCVRVPTGSFVARRNGKVFVTGNSGFPKSLNISKAIDKRGGNSISWFGEWFKEWRIGKGILQKEVSKLFPSSTGGLTGCVANWELGLNLPTCEQFNIIKDAFDLPFDNIYEAEREVVGTNENVLRSRKSTSVNYECNKGSSDITVPATDEAKKWDGFGTCLKPAVEFFTLCRKPLSESTVAANVLRWGTGGLNIDACRVGTESTLRKGTSGDFGLINDDGWKPNLETHGSSYGRWPANLIHDGSDEVVGLFPDTKTNGTGGPKSYKGVNGQVYGDYSMTEKNLNYESNQGSAARFFYTAKASKQERGEGNNHPTVKPIALMEYLIKLITPVGGTVFDPYMGSGTTGVACRRISRKFVGIELDDAYFKIAQDRIEAAKPKLKGFFE